ncbi:unnamed protein product, partial [Notodromas monacha]
KGLIRRLPKERIHRDLAHGRLSGSRSFADPFWGYSKSNKVEGIGLQKLYMAFMQLNQACCQFSIMYSCWKLRYSCKNTLAGLGEPWRVTKRVSWIKNFMIVAKAAGDPRITLWDLCSIDANLMTTLASLTLTYYIVVMENNIGAEILPKGLIRRLPKERIHRDLAHGRLSGSRYLKLLGVKASAVKTGMRDFLFPLLPIDDTDAERTLLSDLLNGCKAVASVVTSGEVEKPFDEIVIQKLMRENPGFFRPGEGTAHTGAAGGWCPGQAGIPAARWALFSADRPKTSADRLATLFKSTSTTYTNASLNVKYT